MIIILIPAYDEAAALERLLPALPARLHGRLVVPLVVDDGSRDGTPDVARAHGVEVVALATNRGKGAALRAGLRTIRSRQFDAVVFMDADGQHAPCELGAIVGPILDRRSDVVCGSRYIDDPGRGPTPLNRYLVRTVVVRYLQRRLGTTITDPFGGFRGVTPEVARSWEPRGDRYEAELELLLACAGRGWVLHEVAVTRIYGEACSKMGAIHGPFLGRLDVLRQYAATMVRMGGPARRGRVAPPDHAGVRS